MIEQNINKDQKKFYPPEEKSGMCTTVEFLKKEFIFYRKSNKIYTSFSNNKEYDLNMTKTVTGLLEDAAATVTTSRKDIQKKTINGIFSAYCLYICASCSSNPQKAYEALLDITQNNQNPIEVIIAWIKEQKKNNVKFSDIKFRENIKKIIITRLKQLKEREYSKKDTFVGNEKKRKRYKKMTMVPWEIKTEDGSYIENMDIVDIMQGIAKDKARLDTIKIVAGSALKYCHSNKKLTDEQCKIICLSYGLGSGYKPLPQKEIAAKLNTNVYQVRTKLDKALSILKDYINSNHLWYE